MQCGTAAIVQRRTSAVWLWSAVPLNSMLYGWRSCKKNTLYVKYIEKTSGQTNRYYITAEAFRSSTTMLLLLSSRSISRQYPCKLNRLSQMVLIVQRLDDKGIDGEKEMRLKRPIIKVMKTLSCLQEEMSYQIKSTIVAKIFDNILIELERPDGFQIRIIRDRSYYTIEVKIKDEYVLMQFVYRYLFPERAIRLNYRSWSGLRDLVFAIKEQLPIIEENSSNISPENIQVFMKEHPGNSIPWIDGN
jgi:hypothetical protein